MLTPVQAREILQTLQMLPADKLAEVYDYLAFLRARYSRDKIVNVDDAWSEEDISDLISASLARAEQVVWQGEE